MPRQSTGRAAGPSTLRWRGPDQRLYTRAGWHTTYVLDEHTGERLSC